MQRSVGLLAAQMARTAERTRTRGADDARASRFAEGRPWNDEDHYGRERLTISR